MFCGCSSLYLGEFRIFGVRVLHAIAMSGRMGLVSTVSGRRAMHVPPTHLWVTHDFKDVDT